MGLSKAFAIIKGAYVEDVDDKKIIEGAIKGMVQSLDPHSSYLTEDDYDDLESFSRGNFGGLGIEIGMENGVVKVISPIDDTPAQKAGIIAGDLIIKIDDKSVRGMTINDAVKLMRGKPGEKITLTIVRKGEKQPFSVDIVRDVIEIKNVKAKYLEQNFIYLRIARFQGNTTDKIKEALKKIRGKRKKSAIEGIVLDLRNNPGGLLTEAVSVSELFLEKDKVVVSIKGREKSSEIPYSSHTTDMFSGAPVVVLINQGSASASEIVAGALQDHKRAIILGETSFGKGSVQKTFPLPGGKSAVKLTTALYYTPNERSIQAKGIVPDIVVESNKVLKERKDVFGKGYSEADLSGHIEQPEDGKKGGNKVPKKQQTNLAETDYQLHEALSLLKGLALYSKNDSSNKDNNNKTATK